jgi:hypothetical protein
VYERDDVGTTQGPLMPSTSIEMSDAEVPEADALEQNRPADPDVADDRFPSDVPPDVPDVDALEQSLEVPMDDDDIR